jgi:hypothetical protein
MLLNRPERKRGHIEIQLKKYSILIFIDTRFEEVMQ